MILAPKRNVRLLPHRDFSVDYCVLVDGNRQDARAIFFRRHKLNRECVTGNGGNTAADGFDLRCLPQATHLRATRDASWSGGRGDAPACRDANHCDASAEWIHKHLPASALFSMHEQSVQKPARFKRSRFPLPLGNIVGRDPTGGPVEAIFSPSAPFLQCSTIPRAARRMIRRAIIVPEKLKNMRVYALQALQHVRGNTCASSNAGPRRLVGAPKDARLSARCI